MNAVGIGPLTRWVLRHRRRVAVLWLLAAAAGLLAAAQIGGRLTGQLAQPGEPAYEANQQILRSYGPGGDQQPLVAVLTAPAGGRITDAGGTAAVAGAFDAVDQAMDVRTVSYASTHDSRLIGSEGQTTFGLVYVTQTGGAMGRGDSATVDRVTELMRQALPAGWTAGVTGIGALQSGSRGGGLGVLTETAVGALGALAVLALVFGSLLALVPLLIAAVSILACFLLLFGLTLVTDVSSVVQFIVALIGLGVAIDYSLLVVTRWREERGRGVAGDDAVVTAMTTAGHAVVVSGLSVAIGLLAMVFLPVPFLRSVGYGGLLIPVVSVLAVLTLLPILLATVGDRLEWPHRRRAERASRAWTAWARGVVRWRWLAAAASLTVLVALGVAAFGLRLGDPLSGSLADSGPAADARTALVSAGVPTGVLTPIEVLAPAGTDPDQLARQLGDLPGVDTAVAPDETTWRRAGTAVIDVLPTDEGGTSAGQDTVDRVRAHVPAGVQVGGSAAQSMDFVSAVYGAFPVMLAVIAAVTLILLARGFGSLLVPIKAVALNLLSLAAILGTVVLVWQDGHGSGLWGIAATGSVTEFIPVMIFAFLYGLSMDYEVFILSRIREEYRATGDPDAAIVAGIGRTGRLVSSAALVLFLAFASLASGPSTELKVFATGLGLGVLLDATIIRGVLVPALLAILGRRCWWLPSPLARLLRVQEAHA